MKRFTLFIIIVAAGLATATSARPKVGLVLGGGGAKGADIVIAVDLQQKEKAPRKKTDIYIYPDLPDYDATSFGNKNCAKMIEAGKVAAMKQWERLRSVMSKE